MTSILSQDLCVTCNTDNGINSSKQCKFCNGLMCKNIWKLNFESSTDLVLSGNSLYNCFQNFLVKEHIIDNKKAFMYRFSFKTVNIDFEKEKIYFKVDNLQNPIIIRFNSIIKYDLTSNLLTIYLGNMVLGIGCNSFNSKIYNVLSHYINS
tara:strand:- start:24 stop:476 length:453 start_codon:yes stop_codon:yes gene_type:complete